MANIGTVWANLKLNITDFAANMTDASAKLRSFSVKNANTFANSTKAVRSYSASLKNLQDVYKEVTSALGKHSLGLKDVARITQGIMISQTFYAGLRAIRSATSAMWDFNEAIDYAKVTYSALFGQVQVAEDFLSVLKEYSIDTVFDYSGLADASKKLAAYGIPYKNLMFVMEGLTNLTTLTGDTAALDRIAYALGQIYAKGKLSAEEMRQLANAYVPIQKILEDKLGVSLEQLEEMNKHGEHIQADAAINAIIDYANEQFGSMADAAMYTITGLENRIVDTIKVAGAAVLQPVSIFYKSFLQYVADALDVYRQAISRAGVKGLFEALVPDPQAQLFVKQFVGTLRDAFMTLASVLLVVKNILGNVLYTFAAAFNIVAPPILTVINLLAFLVNTLISTRIGMAALRVAVLAAASAFIVLRVHAILALVMQTLTKVVYGLAQALLVLSAVIVRHPLIALIIGAGVALAALAVSSKTANNALGNLFNTISRAVGGKGFTDLFTDTSSATDASADALDQFNHRLGETDEAAKDAADSTDKVGDAADKAGKKAKKAAKDLLSFDEVFRLPEHTDASATPTTKKDDGATGVLGDLEALTDGFKGLGESLIPEIPDFSEFISGFTDGLFGGLNVAFDGRLKDGVLGATIGAGIGAVLGSLVGSPLIGAGIGALVGGIAGWLWQDLQKAIEDSEGVAVAQVAIGTTIGAVLGGILGGPAGALIGASIGTLAGGLTAILWDKLAENLSDPNAATNANIGGLIGTTLGAIIGGLLGGPVGAVIGAALGDFAGGFVGLFWSNITSAFSENFSPMAEALSNIWERIKTAWEERDWLSLGGNIAFGILAGIASAIAAIPLTIASFFQGIWDGICEAFGIASPAKEMEPLGEFILKGVLQGILNVMLNIGDWIDEHIFEPIRTALGDFSILDALGAAKENVKTTVTVAVKKASTWASDAWEAVKTGGGTVKRVLQQGVAKGATWVSDAWAAAKEKAANVARSLKQSVEKGSWVSDAWSAVKTTAGTVTRTLAQGVKKGSTWVSDAWSAATKATGTVSRTLAQSVKKGSTWVSDAWAAAIKAAGTIYRTLAQSVKKGSTWVADAWAAAKLVAGTVYRTVVQSVTGGTTKKADGGVLTGGSWKPITAYASGGLPSMGEFFLARERGPELVGRLGGRTAVMNNDQIVASVSAGVYAAVSAATRGLGDIVASLLNTIVDASNAIVGAIGKVSAIGYSAAQAGIASRDTYTTPNAYPASMHEDFMTLTNAVVETMRSYRQPQSASMDAGQVGVSNETLPPVYVGTLIADDRGLRELERRLHVIRLQEGRRGV